MAKYNPLARYLQAQSASELMLSFTAIEGIIGAQLPRSARERPEWWWNDLAPDSSHVQSRSWVRTGYWVRVVDFEGQRVIFCRRTLASSRRGGMVPRNVGVGGKRPTEPPFATADKDAVDADPVGLRKRPAAGKGRPR